ncbi:MAG: hypothetical protein RL700_444, partial [Pseudomonadota bacterium]
MLAVCFRANSWNSIYTVGAMRLKATPLKFIFTICG